MDKKININDIRVDQDVFTTNDALEVAEQIFKLQESEFSRIKNEKWFRRFIKAITLQSSNKKLILTDIRSLAKLQTVFMRVYFNQQGQFDSQIRQIIENQMATNQVVRKLYDRCVDKISPQEYFDQLSERDKHILLLFLSEYHSQNEKEPEFQTYRASVARACGVSLPGGELSFDQIERVSNARLFYRCVLELCALDGELQSFSMPDKIYEALDYLSISSAAKKRLEAEVLREIDTFGPDYYLEKYSGSDILDTEDLVFESLENMSSLPESSVLSENRTAP